MFHPNQIIPKIIESPRLKTALPLIISMCAGLFTNTLNTEITVEGVIRWSKIPETFSFYAIVFCVFILYKLNMIFFNYDKDVAKYKDNEYCRAYLRSVGLPALTARYAELAREGDLASLQQARDEVDRLMR